MELNLYNYGNFNNNKKTLIHRKDNSYLELVLHKSPNTLLCDVCCCDPNLCNCPYVKDFTGNYAIQACQSDRSDSVLAPYIGSIDKDKVIILEEI